MSNMVYPRYSQLFPALKEVRDSLEQSYFAQQAEVEAKALEMQKTNRNEAIKYLNNYSVDKATQMLQRWNKLATYLIVKFNDMAVKPEKNGQFERTKTGLGATVSRPGYPKEYARKMLQLKGEFVTMPEAE